MHWVIAFVGTLIPCAVLRARSIHQILWLCLLNLALCGNSFICSIADSFSREDLDGRFLEDYFFFLESSEETKLVSPQLNWWHSFNAVPIVPTASGYSGSWTTLPVSLFLLPLALASLALLISLSLSLFLLPLARALPCPVSLSHILYLFCDFSHCLSLAFSGFLVLFSSAATVAFSHPPSPVLLLFLLSFTQECQKSKQKYSN